MFRQITMDELKDLALKAYGQIEKAYLHWTGVKGGKHFTDYHINIDRDGIMWTDMEDLTDYKKHTYMRNSNAVGIAIEACWDAVSENNLGSEPPTKEQLATMTQIMAVLTINAGVPLDLQHQMTHAEAADNKDGLDLYYLDPTGYPNNTYGPDSNVDRWDLLVCHAGDERWSGGEWLRGTARWWGAQWGSTIQKGITMYETIKNRIISSFTKNRVVIGVLSIILICFACSLVRGYLDTRADYQRTREQLERTQRALDESRKLNQQLRESIAASQQLNRDAGNSINRIEDYQRRTDEGIERAQSNQRETGARINESLQSLDNARSEIERSLDLIRRIDRTNQTQQTNRTAP